MNEERKRLDRLREELEACRRAHERARGTRDHLLRRLNEEYGFATVEEARVGLKKMVEEGIARARGVREGVCDYVRAFGERLRGEGGADPHGPFVGENDAGECYRGAGA